ncbi:MAG: hypothetical protein B5766_12880 [Candidatus Lumbricidophila eiseniae]|uniref:Helix-turn-helix domain-containing protein n=1 Tax=Candidatus Lumbricidiphila eiseniae TaxID=1969409 RepID=A0A2A6FNF0_9MICO|nr:MAG: hypothetical protein B5766_12880 [Candidatus Lumbricidophila eiseniae]
MSVESLAIALHHSRARGAAKLVLIGIANHDGDGGAWPAVATLARYAGVTERNVQKALAALESLGEIRRLVSSGGDHSTADHMKPNLYQFLLRCPSNCDRSARHRRPHDTQLSELSTGELSTGVSLATPGVGSDTGGVSLATPEPSFNQTTRYREKTHVIARARVGGTGPSVDNFSVSARRYVEVMAVKCRGRGGRPHRYVDGQGLPSHRCLHCGELQPVEGTA